MIPISTTAQALEVGSQINFCEAVELMREKQECLANSKRALRLARTHESEDRRRFYEIAEDYTFKAQMLSETITAHFRRYEKEGVN